MGWSSGVPVFRSAWDALRPFVGQANRVAALTHLMLVFMEADCDNLDELEGEWPEFGESLALAYRRRQRPNPHGTQDG